MGRRLAVMKSIQRNQSHVKELNVGYMSQKQKSRLTVYFLGPLQFSDLKYKYFVNTSFLNTFTHYLSVHIFWSWKESGSVSD
jgi:hypothetical protein